MYILGAHVNNNVIDYESAPILTTTYEAIPELVPFHGDSSDSGFRDCKCCGVVGTLAKSKKSKSESKRNYSFLVRHM